jgi:hypothetical protein
MKFEGNLLTWKAPRDDRQISHYRIRIDTDIGDPDIELPAGQRTVPLYGGDTFYLSSYNAVTKIESEKVVLGVGYGPTENVQLGGMAGTISFSAISKAMSDPTDFGLRWWIVTCDYTANIADLQEVAIWVENPSDDPPEKAGTSRYISGQSNSALIAIDPPGSSTEIRVYLTPITEALVGELKTVADYGDQPAQDHYA